jgi:hypothetical protein
MDKDEKNQSSFKDIFNSMQRKLECPFWLKIAYHKEYEAQFTKGTKK